MTLPLFSTHYSFGGASILTLEEAGKTKPGNPVSICDLAREHHLKTVTIVDDRIDGFIEAHKNLSKPFKAAQPKSLADYIKARQGTAKTASDADCTKAHADLAEAIAKAAREATWSTDPIALQFGVKLVVVPDMTVKDDASLRAESSIIVFARNSDGYGDLIKLWNRAWTEGFYYQGRLDWKTLRRYWTANLTLALPFFSSFLARNTLTFSAIVPDLSVTPWVFKEVDSRLSFAGLLGEAVDRYVTETGAPVELVKSIYYARPEDFDAYITFRASDNRGTFSAPNVSHLASDQFSFAAWRALA